MEKVINKKSSKTKKAVKKVKQNNCCMEKEVSASFIDWCSIYIGKIARVVCDLNNDIILVNKNRVK